MRADRVAAPNTFENHTSSDLNTPIHPTALKLHYHSLHRIPLPFKQTKKEHASTTHFIKERTKAHLCEVDGNSFLRSSLEGDLPEGATSIL
jgi:hypothetical protein